MKKDSNQRDWENFLKSPSHIYDKEEKKKEDKINYSRKKLDLHGHTIDEANQKMNQLILSCYEKGINELLIITGKGSHSKKNNNVYTSEENLKLQASIPEFIKNNSELNSKIK